MRAVVQRVKNASVTVDRDEKGRIENGLLVYLGVADGDTDRDLDYLVAKIAGLRIFRDENGAMNRSVLDAGGSALVISQFTLHGDVRKGRRPSFTGAMEPVNAEKMYLGFVEKLSLAGVPCSQGVFGATMDIASTNDGPVTILLDSTRLF